MLTSIQIIIIIIVIIIIIIIIIIINELIIHELKLDSSLRDMQHWYAFL